MLFIYYNRNPDSLLKYRVGGSAMDDMCALSHFNFDSVAANESATLELLLATYFSLVGNYYFIVCAFYINMLSHNSLIKYSKYIRELVSVQDTIALILSGNFSTISTRLLLRDLFKEEPTMCWLETEDYDNNYNLVPFNYCDPIVDPETFLKLYHENEIERYGTDKGSLFYSLAIYK